MPLDQYDYFAESRLFDEICWLLEDDSKTGKYHVPISYKFRKNVYYGTLEIGKFPNSYPTAYIQLEFYSEFTKSNSEGEDNMRNVDMKEKMAQSGKDYADLGRSRWKQTLQSFLAKLNLNNAGEIQKGGFWD